MTRRSRSFFQITKNRRRTRSRKPSYMDRGTCPTSKPCPNAVPLLPVTDPLLDNPQALDNHSCPRHKHIRNSAQLPHAHAHHHDAPVRIQPQTQMPPLLKGAGQRRQISDILHRLSLQFLTSLHRHDLHQKNTSHRLSHNLRNRNNITSIILRKHK